MLQAKSDDDVFPELSLSLLSFMKSLYEELRCAGATSVYFLAREGQPLMEMFNLYQSILGLKPIESKYLLVSRRSTLLPSLAPLGEETFDTLFRQYIHISASEFLSSLGLEKSLPSLGNELGLSPEDLNIRITDFPSSTIFRRMIASPAFQKLYEEERRHRQAAFLSYLRALSGGALPEHILVVDVGWKGTIQDNLANLFRNSDVKPQIKLTGMYVGLVAEGSASAWNIKKGLLFSSVDGKSKKFGIFNENRAVFEVVLAADHGSVASYQINEDGAQPVIGEFEEELLVRDKIMPVQRHMVRRFEELCHVLRERPTSELHYFDALVARMHARMVFRPRQAELQWFSSVFHVENFGVFERSTFISKRERSLISRLTFVVRLFNGKVKGELGFWPYKTVHDNSFRFVARLYALARGLQK
ncbi:MAG: hypothetical protein CME36_15180 [unclassified Hahellaceae]|nr:hypothetical protein [Hahellaceae bacterium]